MKRTKIKPRQRKFYLTRKGERALKQVKIARDLDTNSATVEYALLSALEATKQERVKP